MPVRAGQHTIGLGSFGRGAALPSAKLAQLLDQFGRHVAAIDHRQVRRRLAPVQIAPALEGPARDRRGPHHLGRQGDFAPAGPPLAQQALDQGDGDGFAGRGMVGGDDGCRPGKGGDSATPSAPSAAMRATRLSVMSSGTGGR